MKYLGLFIWLVMSSLAGMWMHFHYTWFDTWAPTTFTQFVVVLIAGMLWFGAAIALELIFRRGE